MPPETQIPSIITQLTHQSGESDAIIDVLRAREAAPDTNSISNPIFDPATVQHDAQETRIIVHAEYPQLVQAFLAHKRRHGSSVEKRFYSNPDWTWEKQVARLLAKRPLMFMTSGDFTMLRDGTYVDHGTSEWDKVGTDTEDTNQHLRLAEYLNYDEIMLGSLLGVSSPSSFINDGNRHNAGIVGKLGTYEERGIIMGLVGARFERSDRMDSMFIKPAVANPRQHPELNSIFRNFFAPEQRGFEMPSDNPRGFDVNMYKARMRITIDILLLEANSRAQAAGKKAYVYIVGLGLGVWAQYGVPQSPYYIEAFTQALNELGHRLQLLGTLEFAWINVSYRTQVEVQAAADTHMIDVIFSHRNPAEKLMGEAADQLLVLSYAWDGNAFPGNEYWDGSLDGSGDPAAACMSQISELHNPVLNPGVLGRIEVLGDDLS